MGSGGADSDNHIQHGKDVLDTCFGIENRLPCELVDYLRSKSYTLPFMGLSVEKQIEYGWIKLKTE